MHTTGEASMPMPINSPQRTTHRLSSDSVDTYGQTVVNQTGNIMFWMNIITIKRIILPDFI